MRMLFIVALRNIVGHKRRVLLTAFTIAAGLGALIAIDSMLKGWDGSSIDTMLSVTDGAVTIFDKNYFAVREAMPLTNGIIDYPGVAASIRKNKEAVGITPRSYFRAEITDGINSYFIRGVVIDPASDSMVFALPSYLRKGRFLSNRSHNEVLIGDKLAHDFGIDIGATLTIAAFNRYDSQNADDYTVVGIYSTGNIEYDGSTCVMSFDAANALVDLNGMVSAAHVQVAHSFGQSPDLMKRNAQRLAAQISVRLPQYSIHTFSSMNAVYFAMMSMEKSYDTIFVMIVLLIAAVGIVNNVLMSVYERIREIGVLRALGFNRHEISMLFVIEGGIVGAIGSVGGLLLGTLINMYLIFIGIDYGSISGVETMMRDLPNLGVMRGVWNAGMFFSVFSFGILISIIASVIPARKAGSITVTEALRFH